MRYAASCAIAFAIFGFSAGWDGDWADFSLIGLIAANTVLIIGAWLQLRKQDTDNRREE